jgi:SHS2 domain-containing protein
LTPEDPGGGASGTPVPRVGGAPAFEAVDHTADLAYLVRGRTWQQLFEHAALGMFAFLIDLKTVAPRQCWEIAVEGADREECLITWLQELLFREEIHGWLLARVQVDEAGPSRVRGRIWGEILDPARHELLTDIKAATYHDLELRTTEGAAGTLHEVRIVLDI